MDKKEGNYNYLDSSPKCNSSSHAALRSFSAKTRYEVFGNSLALVEEVQNHFNILLGNVHKTTAIWGTTGESSRCCFHPTSQVQQPKTVCRYLAVIRSAV